MLRRSTRWAINHASWRVERARTLAAAAGVAGYQALQLRRSYLEPRPGARVDDGHLLAGADSLDYARTEGLPMWVYTPLLNGAYVRADRPIPEVYHHPGTTRRLAVLADVAAECDATMNQVVLARLLADPTPTSPIVGVSSLAQLDEMIAARDLLLADDQLLRLDEPR